VSAAGADFWSALPLGPGVRLITRDPNGLAAFAKPAGVLSHPNERGDEPRSLLDARYDLEAQCFTWNDPAGAAQKLWLLNRLDGATSGVILCAATEKLALAIRENFAKKQVRKVYLALVFGRPTAKTELWRDLVAVTKKGGTVRANTAAGNIPAVTQFSALQHQQGAFSTSLIRLEPHTGRSHQLRVQCAKRHLPIVGDQTYGDFALNRAFAKATGHKRLFLHSTETSFSYDFGGKTWKFHALAPLPEEFKQRW
jgi:23S rRNA-/tRNA-specific pseudouridylate synthase